MNICQLTYMPLAMAMHFLHDCLLGFSQIAALGIAFHQGVVPQMPRKEVKPDTLLEGLIATHAYVAGWELGSPFKSKTQASHCRTKSLRSLRHDVHAWSLPYKKLLAAGEGRAL